jgi:uncharacterized delta-60 repeat protein
MNIRTHDSRRVTARFHRNWLSAVVLAASIASMPPAFADEPTPPLALFETMAQSAATSAPAPAFRRPAQNRRVRLHSALAAAPRPHWKQGQQIRLDLLPEQDVTMEIVDVRTTADGATELDGTCVGIEGGRVHLVLAQDGVGGIARIPGLGTYEWVPAGNGISRAQRVPATGGRPCAAVSAGISFAASHQGTFRNASLQGAEDGLWDPATDPVGIDVLILYSSRAVEAHGNEAALQDALRAMLGRANRAYTNSLIGVQLRPVHVGLHPTWTESGNMDADFGTLFSDSRVTQLRNDYKADLVCLVIESDSGGATGSATVLGNPQGDAAKSLCIIRRNILTGSPLWAEFENITFTHEFGHMLGAGHDREHGFPTPFQGTPSAFAYSNGHRFEAGSITYRTAMAYDPGIQLSLFSNPNLSFEGQPLGIAAGQLGASDNAQTMNRTAPKVASYRTALSRIGFTDPSMIVSESDKSVTVRLIRTGDLNTSTRVTLGFDTSSQAKPGLDYVRPASALVSFATNQATAEVIIPLLQDEILEGDETLRLSLSSVTGNHGLDTRSTSVITLRDDESPFVLDASALTLVEGRAAEVWVEFTGPLADGTSHTVAIAPASTGDSANPGMDFTVTPTDLVFTPTTRRQSIRIETLADELAEPDETARITVGTARLDLRILDTRRPGSLLSTAAPDGPVVTATALGNGGVLIAGEFTRVGDLARTGIARLRPDGSPDPDFQPPALLASPAQQPGVPPAKIVAATQLRDGRWLVGGTIGLADGRPAGNLIRLAPDGHLDPTFQHPGFDGTVTRIVELPNRSILIAGTFDHVGAQPIRGLARLNPDGSLDATFRLEPGFEGVLVAAFAVAAQPNGRILVGGFLQQYNGQAVQNLVRLNADGSLDTTFPLLKTGLSGYPTCAAALPDGRAYVGGYFEAAGGRAYKGLVRLNANGGVDTTFRAVQPNGEILGLQPLPNGRLLVNGAFTVIGGLSRRFVALLNEDGTVNADFDLGRAGGDHVWTLAASGDGSLWTGGVFSTFNDQPAPYLARVRLPSIPGVFLGSATSTATELSTRVLGLPGARYGIDASPDLKTWSPAGEVQISNPDATGVFTTPITNDARFFRLREP